MLIRGLRLVLAVMFIIGSVFPGQAYAQGVAGLPAPGVMLRSSGTFMPVTLRALKIRPNEPLVFDFIVDSGDTGAKGQELKAETEKLAKYFLAGLAVPEQDLWVNLSPYESGKIVPEGLGQTVMGRDMLAQDYVLKQMASSLVDPDQALGKDFWQRVYARARQELGDVNIPMDTFNKIWIVPQSAQVYEKTDAALLGEMHLQVMLAEDYTAMKANVADNVSTELTTAVSQVSSDVVRQIILPELEKEVNTGKNFAPLRQLTGAMVLATWYKQALQESLLAKVYNGQNKVAGVDLADKTEKDQIYAKYVEAYKKGVLDIIREDTDPVSGEVLPRKYFSGGLDNSRLGLTVAQGRRPMSEAGEAVDDGQTAGSGQGAITEVTVALAEQGVGDRLGVVRTFPHVLPAAGVTRYSLYNLVFKLSERLNRPLLLKNKEMEAGVTFNLTEDGLVTVNFADGSNLSFRIDGNRILLSDDQDGLVSQVIETVLMEEDRFAVTGYSRPVAERKIRSMIEQGRLHGLKTKRNDVQKSVGDALEGANDYLLRNYQGPRLTLESISILESGGEETFGIAYIDGRLVIEQAFLGRVTVQSNPYGMLTRAMIFAVAAGDWFDKKMAATYWARRTYPNLASDPQIAVLNAMEQHWQSEVNWELLDSKTMKFTANDIVRITAVLQDVNYRIGVFFGALAGMVMDKEIHDDPKRGRILFDPLAADPLHWGQVDMIFRAMVTGKALHTNIRLQGADIRKLRTLMTLIRRTEHMDDFLGAPAIREYMQMPHKYTGTVDGETEILNYILDHVDEFPEMLELLYLVGSDHRHLEAPNRAKPDQDGKFGPIIMPDGKEQPDTILKLEMQTLIGKLQDMKSALVEGDSQVGERVRRIEKAILRLTQGTIRIKALFSDRSPFDAVPNRDEKERLENEEKLGNFEWMLGLNVEHISSTLLRKAVAGQPDAQWSWALMPKSAFEMTESDVVYEGDLTEMPDNIRRIADGTSSESDRNLFVSWVTKYLNLKLDDKMVTREELARSIAADFTLTEEEVVRRVGRKAFDEPNFQHVYHEKFGSGNGIVLEEKAVLQALEVVDFSESTSKKLAGDLVAVNGGIDLDPALFDMQIERSGGRVHLNVDPAEVARIMAGGVAGFRPVIVSFRQVDNLFREIGAVMAVPVTTP